MVKELTIVAGKGLLFWTIVLCTIWSLRTVADGVLITGIVACLMFGMSMWYFTNTLTDIFVKKSIVQY